MKTWIKRLARSWTEPFSIMTIIIMLLWLIFDFSERFIASRNKLISPGIRFEEIQRKTLTISSDQKTEILSLYSQYTLEKQANQSIGMEKGLSIEKQILQNGELDQLFAGDIKIELKAIITDSRPNTSDFKVMLQILTISTGERKIETYANGGDVYGYTLQVEENTQITLSRINRIEERDVLQKVVLTMYNANPSR